jgi:hypothetical protein
VSFRLDPDHGARTPIQVATVAFGDFVEDARRELNEREWISFISIVASWAARENARGLEDEERPR